MTRENISIIAKALVKVYLVYLFFDIVWPGAEMKNIEIMSREFFYRNFRRFLKFGIPTCSAVMINYFLSNKDS